MTTKDELRAQLGLRRQNLSKIEQELAAKAVSFNLQPLLEAALKVAIYHPYRAELNPAPIAAILAKLGKQIYQPIAYRSSRILRFEAYQNQRCPIFYPSDYRLVDEISWESLDLVILPLLAVDRVGYRLGQGGGYYDSTFGRQARRAPVLCGIGYDWQLVNDTKPESWDISLDYFVSEQQIYPF